MIFTYKAWDKFCGALSDSGIKSISANQVTENNRGYLVLKHDVETDVSRAYDIAMIEHRYGHRGTYYVQAYLMDDAKNIEFLKRMQNMGHEISYHYDVMDSNKGDIERAITEFGKNLNVFEKNGISIQTVCQHGNPVIERVGYTSNRDFFRNKKVQELYPHISDIMVDYKRKHKTDYSYFSDAGRKFKLIYDPLYNDIIPSDDKNIVYDDLTALYKAINMDNGNIISIHPHRWTRSPVIYILKSSVFKVIKSCAKLLIKIPIFKKIMSRYYYLAKKI